MGITVVYDATHANISALPAGGFYAGYTTGTPDIAWTSADFSARPGTIHIDQSPSSSVWDATADVDDFESGAVTLVELAPRAKLRLAAFANGTRPGQRTPLVYASESKLTDVANALIAGGVNSGVGLWVANWNLTDPEAVARVQAASGPFPVRGVQFHNAGSFDMSVFDSAWLNTVSHSPSSQVPTGTITSAPTGRWEKAAVVGVGMDGNIWYADYDTASGKWGSPAKIS